MECTSCQTLLKQIEEMSAQMEEMGMDLHLTHKDVLRLRRVEAGLRAKLAQQSDDAPDAENVREVALYWQLKIRPKSKVPSDGKRADVIKKALKRNSVTDLKNAIDGMALDDWAMGRHP